MASAEKTVNPGPPPTVEDEGGRSLPQAGRSPSLSEDEIVKLTHGTVGCSNVYATLAGERGHYSVRILTSRGNANGSGLDVLVSRDRRGKIDGLLPHDMALHLIYAHNACMIGGTPAWQEYPDTRFVVEDDMKQAVSRWSTGFYRTGLTGMMKACSHYAPNLPKRKYQEVLDALESELSDRPDLHFETDRRTIATIDGTVLRFDPFAPRDQDPFAVVPHLAPEDHVVYGGAFRVRYDPSIDYDPIVDSILWDWADNDPCRLARMVEAIFGQVLMSGIRYRGLIILRGPGRDGKGGAITWLTAMCPENEVKSFTKCNDIGDRFGLGLRHGLRASVTDDMPEGMITNEAMATIKSLVAGETVWGELKHAGTVPVSDMAVIICTNHDVSPSQMESSQDALADRAKLVLFKNQYAASGSLLKTDKAADSQLIDGIPKDETHMSYLFNLALAAARRLHARQGYTKVEEDDLYCARMLGTGDTVADFLRWVGGVEGRDWDCPRLYTLARGEELLLVPAWFEVDQHALRDGRAMEGVLVRDMRKDEGHVVRRLVGWRNQHIPVAARELTRRVDDAPKFCLNKLEVLYRLYEHYCGLVGQGNSVVRQSNFVAVLERKGYHVVSQPVRDQYGRSTRNLVIPSTYPLDSAGYKAFLADEAATHRYPADAHNRREEAARLNGQLARKANSLRSSRDQEELMDAFLEETYCSLRDHAALYEKYGDVLMARILEVAQLAIRNQEAGGQP